MLAQAVFSFSSLRRPAWLLCLGWLFVSALCVRPMSPGPPVLCSPPLSTAAHSPGGELRSYQATCRAGVSRPKCRFRAPTIHHSWARTGRGRRKCAAFAECVRRVRLGFSAGAFWLWDGRLVGGEEGRRGGPVHKGRGPLSFWPGPAGSPIAFRGNRLARLLTLSTLVVCQIYIHVAIAHCRRN